MEFKLFKIEYDWCEGDHEEILLGKEVERDEFEKDLVAAKDFAISLLGKELKEGDYLGKGYHLDCLPEYYEQIIWFLINKKGYIAVSYDSDISYKIVDSNSDKIEATRFEKTISTKEL